MNDQKYKIEKYTYKLKNATDMSKANLYQQKLQSYHNLNKKRLSGGGPEEDLALDNLKKTLSQQQNMIQQKIDSIAQVSGVDIDELKKQLAELNDKINEIKTRLKYDEDAFGILGPHIKTITNKLTEIQPGESKWDSKELDDLNQNTESILNSTPLLKKLGLTPLKE